MENLPQRLDAETPEADWQAGGRLNLDEAVNLALAPGLDAS
jgi:hypothetical protein